MLSRSLFPLSRRYASLSTPIRSFCSIQTPSSLEADTSIKELLSSNNLTATTSLLSNPKVRVSILARLSALTSQPVSSDAISKLQTTREMTEWFVGCVERRGNVMRGHGRSIIEQVVEDEVGPGQKDEAIGKAQKMIPRNLALDPKAFEFEKKGSVRRKGWGRKKKFGLGYGRMEERGMIFGEKGE